MSETIFKQWYCLCCAKDLFICLSACLFVCRQIVSKSRWTLTTRTGPTCSGALSKALFVRPFYDHLELAMFLLAHKHFHLMCMVSFYLLWFYIFCNYYLGPLAPLSLPLSVTFTVTIQYLLSLSKYYWKKEFMNQKWLWELMPHV